MSRCSGAKCIMRIIKIILLAIALIAPLFIRAYMASMQDLKAARSCLENFDCALKNYSSAIAWGMQTQAIAKEALEFVSLAKDENIKRLALYELQSALLSSRSWLRPESKDNKSLMLSKIEQEIEKTLSPEERSHYIREVNKYEPNHLFQALSHIGFWGWVICVLLAIWKGIKPSGQIIKEKFFPRFGLAALFLLWWLFSLSQA